MTSPMICAYAPRPWIAAILLLLLTTFVTAEGGTPIVTPIIKDISADSLERGRRLLIDGTGFGAPGMGGEVRIGGASAIVRSWSETSVHAYVPEDAPFGRVDVVVVTSGGTSNAVPLKVTPRKPKGRELWRFEMNNQLMLHRPAIGSDGTVYTKSAAGDLFAITPDGGIQWFLQLGQDWTGTIDVGPDDTVYVSEEPGPVIRAINPDGTAKWAFPDSNSQGIVAGPNVGPDGNIYVVDDIGGLGAFSLTPQGQLRWVANVPPYSVYGQLGQEIVFGSDQLFFCLDGRFDSFTFDGSLIFEDFIITPSSSDSPQTAVGPSGNSYVEMWNRIRSYDKDGNLLWTFFDVNGNTLSDPDVGPDGTIYVVRNLINLYAINPNGTQKWHHVDPWILFSPIMSPLGDVLIMGGRFNYGQPGFIKAVDAGGTPLWRIDLPTEPSGPNGAWDVVPQGRPRFSKDGGVAYVMATGPTLPVSTGYLYAVQVEAIASLGHGLAGAAGIPTLTGTGTLKGGSPITLSLSQARPNTQVLLIVGTQAPALPLFGGVLLPSLDLIIPLQTNGAGEAQFAATWPSNIPSNIVLYVQAWITDATGPKGYAASNALSLITP
jgi:hypothetical protein